MSFHVLNLGFDHLERGQWNWKNVCSPFTRLYCVTQGTAYIYLQNRQRLQVTPGHLYIVPTGTLHSNECIEQFDHYYLHVYEETDGTASLFDCYEMPFEVEAMPIHAELMDTLCREFPQAKLSVRDPSVYGKAIQMGRRPSRTDNIVSPENISQQMLLSSAVQLMLGQFLKHARQRQWTHDKRLLTVQQHIHKNLDKHLEIKELAAMACLTSGSFIRLFRCEFGQSPLQYINQKRIEQAQLLLVTQPTMQVQDVAYTTGFSDPAYFVRLFRTKTGHTPLQYRKQVSL